MQFAGLNRLNARGRCFGPTNTIGGLFMPAGALALYATRQQDGYSGPCLRVVRASDSATLDVGFAADGAIDMTAAATFQGASTLAVDIWYDQSGNGQHATQTVAASRPELVASNAVRGKQGITFWTNSSRWLDIPAAVTASRQSLTAFSVAALHASQTSTTLWMLDTVAADRVAQLSAADQNGVVLLDNASFRASALHARAQTQVIVTAMGAASTAVHVDGRSNAAITASTAATTNGGFIGKGELAQYQFNGEFFLYAVYPTTMTTAAINTEKTKLYSLFDVDVASTDHILFDGDSITFGQGSTRGLNNPKQLEAQLLRRVFVTNKGVPGRTMNTVNSNKTNNVVNAYRSGLNNILVIAAGSNDLSNSITGDTIYNSYLLPYIVTAKAAGYSVIVGTVLPRTGFPTTSKETERLAYNALITNGAPANGYAVVDYANIPEMANTANTTYYADGIHPTSAGYLAMANLLRPIVEAKF